MKASFDSQSLKALKADFAAFRSRNRRHARIPEHLRRAVLSAIASGLDRSLLKSSFGVSEAQVAIWSRRISSQKAVAVAEGRPRVLDVIPPIPETGAPTGLRVSYEAGRLLLELSF